MIGVHGAMINDNSCIYGWRERGYTFCIYSATTDGRVLILFISRDMLRSVSLRRRASLSAKLVESN